jgi:hypothetical protein
MPRHSYGHTNANTTVRTRAGALRYQRPRKRYGMEEEAIEVRLYSVHVAPRARAMGAGGRGCQFLSFVRDRKAFPDPVHRPRPLRCRFTLQHIPPYLLGLWQRRHETVRVPLSNETISSIHQSIQKKKIYSSNQQCT